MIAVVDEEVGGADGAIWLTENHPAKARCDYLINEGAGALIEVEGERTYGVCVAEKGVLRFRISTEGVAGHASNPKMGVNSLLKMAPLLQRMADHEAPFDLSDPGRGPCSPSWASRSTAIPRGRSVRCRSATRRWPCWWSRHCGSRWPRRASSPRTRST